MVLSAMLSSSQIPTKPSETPTPEEVEAARAAIEEAPKPVFMHCMRMRRTAAIVRTLGLHPMSEVPVPHKDEAEAEEEEAKAEA